jgi:hypothetical protein
VRSQTESFTRIELAYHAVNLAMCHHVPRCVEFLVGERPPSGTGKPDDRMVGYSGDTIAAANDHIFRSDRLVPGPSQLLVFNSGPLHTHIS